MFDSWPHSVGQGSGIAMSCGVGHRCSSDPELLWLRRRLVVTAPIRPLAWEPPHAMGAALENTERHTHKKVNLYLTLAFRILI